MSKEPEAEKKTVITTVKEMINGGDRYFVGSRGDNACIKIVDSEIRGQIQWVPTVVCHLLNGETVELPASAVSITRRPVTEDTEHDNGSEIYTSTRKTIDRVVELLRRRSLTSIVTTHAVHPQDPGKPQKFYIMRDNHQVTIAEVKILMNSIF